jgi:hypothetical protein
MESILNAGSHDGLRKAYWNRYKHKFNRSDEPLLKHPSSPHPAELEVTHCHPSPPPIPSSSTPTIKKPQPPYRSKTARQKASTRFITTHLSKGLTEKAMSYTKAVVSLMPTSKQPTPSSSESSQPDSPMSSPAPSSSPQKYSHPFHWPQLIDPQTETYTYQVPKASYVQRNEDSLLIVSPHHTPRTQQNPLDVNTPTPSSSWKTQKST